MYDHPNDEPVGEEDPSHTAYQQARQNISTSKKKPALNNFLMPQ